MFVDIIGESKEYITDVLVKLLQDDVNKDTLWRLFGEVIYSNLERNLQGTKICKKCGCRFYTESKKMNEKYCKDCSKKVKNEQNKRYRTGNIA